MAGVQHTRPVYLLLHVRVFRSPSWSVSLSCSLGSLPKDNPGLAGCVRGVPREHALLQVLLEHCVQFHPLTKWNMLVTAHIPTAT